MFYRRGSVVVPTAPYSVHHPWQVEWSKGSKLFCYLGIIADKKAVYTEEWQPRRFPEKIAMSIAVTTHGMSQRSLSQNRTKMNAKPFATGAKSGSAVILKRPDFGRTNEDNGEYIDAEKGCADWDETELIGGGASDSIYLVLHSTENVWFLSWVDEDDLDYKDIKIAVIKKSTGRGIRDWHLLQLWKSDVVVQESTTNRFYDIYLTESGTAGTFRVKFKYDNIVDWNQYSGVSYRSWVPESPWTNQYTFYTPVINDVPVSSVEESNPYFEITETSYFFLEFTHAATIGAGNIAPDEEGYEWIADSITKVELKKSSTPMSGNWFNPPNTTSTLFRHQIGYVEVTDGTPKIVMQSFPKLEPSAMYRIIYGGTWSPSVWSYDDVTSSYVMDSSTTITGNWFYGIDQATSLTPLT